MRRKYVTVATAENGETTLVKIDKTPTGKVKTIKDREKIRKEREEQYQNFRIGALKRRAKRMGLSEEETAEKIEELKKQLDTPNSYDVLIFFNPNNTGLVKAALQKEGLVYKFMSTHQKKESDGFVFLEADQETLKTIREIMPPGSKIHPYVKKKPPVLKDVKKEVIKKPSNNKKGTTKFHAKHWKRPNMAALSKKDRKEFKDKVKALRASWKAVKPKKATTVHLKPKKGSKSLKKASTNLKKAA